jgi:hypothetical protein
VYRVPGALHAIADLSADCAHLICSKIIRGDRILVLCYQSLMLSPTLVVTPHFYIYLTYSLIINELDYINCVDFR